MTNTNTAADLKAATVRLIQQCGGFERAAQVTRCPVVTLRAWSDQASPEFVPLDVVQSLESLCGFPLITAMLAANVPAFVLPMRADLTEKLRNAGTNALDDAAEAVAQKAALVANVTEHVSASGAPSPDVVDDLLQHVLYLRSLVSRSPERPE